MDPNAEIEECVTLIQFNELKQFYIALYSTYICCLVATNFAGRWIPTLRLKNVSP